MLILFCLMETRFLLDLKESDVLRLSLIPHWLENKCPVSTKWSIDQSCNAMRISEDNSTKISYLQGVPLSSQAYPNDYQRKFKLWLQVKIWQKYWLLLKESIYHGLVDRYWVASLLSKRSRGSASRNTTHKEPESFIETVLDHQ